MASNRERNVQLFVNALIGGFDDYVGAFTATPPFRPEQLHAHQQTIQKLRAICSPEKAVRDRAFL